MKPEEFIHLKGAENVVLPRRLEQAVPGPGHVATRIIGAIATALIVAVLVSAAVRFYATSSAHASPERALENLVDARLNAHLTVPRLAKK